MKVFSLLTPYCGVPKPLAYWPYQSVRMQHVINEHIFINKSNAVIDGSYALFMQKGASKQNDTSSAISTKYNYLTCPLQGQPEEWYLKQVFHSLSETTWEFRGAT